MKEMDRQEIRESGEEQLLEPATGGANTDESEPSLIALKGIAALGTAAAPKRQRQQERVYFHSGNRSAFLVMRDGREERHMVQDDGKLPAGPCLIRGGQWLEGTELSVLAAAWRAAGDGGDEETAVRLLRRLYVRMRAEAETLLEAPEAAWTAFALPETEGGRRGSELQDALLEALFKALQARQRQGRECRLDLLVPQPAGAAEFAMAREFIETVAEQTLGHREAAACRIGALFAPDAPHAAAGEIARIADFLVLDGGTEERPASGDAAGFAAAAQELLAAVRRVRPAAAVFAAGADAAAALADLYRIGLSGIFCPASQRTEALLRAACLAWMERQEEGGAYSAGG